jgi:hypothetical protein
LPLDSRAIPINAAAGTNAELFATTKDFLCAELCKEGKFLEAEAIFHETLGILALQKEGFLIARTRHKLCMVQIDLSTSAQNRTVHVILRCCVLSLYLAKSCCPCKKSLQKQNAIAWISIHT